MPARASEAQYTGRQNPETSCAAFASFAPCSRPYRQNRRHSKLNGARVKQAQELRPLTGVAMRDKLARCGSQIVLRHKQISPSGGISLRPLEIRLERIRHLFL